MPQNVRERKTVTETSGRVKVSVTIENSSGRSGGSGNVQRFIRDQVIPELKRAMDLNTRGFDKSVRKRKR
jgi:hypothetical protein